MKEILQGNLLGVTLRRFIFVIFHNKYQTYKYERNRAGRCYPEEVHDDTEEPACESPVRQSTYLPLLDPPRPALVDAPKTNKYK